MLLLSAPPCEKQPRKIKQAQFRIFHTLMLTIQSLISPTSYPKSSLGYLGGHAFASIPDKFKSCPSLSERTLRVGCQIKFQSAGTEGS